jgi:hypothetical protein
MLGIVEEQHPDRTRLFMQWKQMSWPVMVDSLDLLGVSGVPTTFLIDEAGIIRGVRPDDAQLEEFLEEPGPKSENAERARKTRIPNLEALEEASSNGHEGADSALADAVFLWHPGQDPLDRAIELYSKALEQSPDDGTLHFRRGVAYRKRSELAGDANDFRLAVEDWSRALEINPNQYIWRRRIQQYGPRLDKPYSFYDWIHQARKDIADRGETPDALSVEPGGAEFAYPAENVDATAQVTMKNPDPQGRVFRDTEGMIQIRQILVPDTSRGNRVVRVHLEFEPNQAKKAHWNNEAGEMQVWVDPPKGWSTDARLLRYPVPPEPVSVERRSVEFELMAPEDFTGQAAGNAYALYYVCEDVNGTCLYRRQDLPIRLEVETGNHLGRVGRQGPRSAVPR